MIEALPQFLNAMRTVGLEPPEMIEAGKLHRFPGIGKAHDNTAGWCKLFDDGLGGCFGDWSSGIYENWQASRDRPCTPAEQDSFSRHVAEARAQSGDERKARQSEAATKAEVIWNGAVMAPESHSVVVAT